MTKSKHLSYLLLLFKHCPFGNESNDCCLGHLRATVSKQYFMTYLQSLPEEVIRSYILRHERCRELGKKRNTDQTD